MGDQITQPSGKLRALDFTLKKTDAVLTKEEEEVSSRQKMSITKIIMAICDLKQVIEESKLSEGETEEAVSAWGEEIEQRMFYPFSYLQWKVGRGDFQEAQNTSANVLYIFEISVPKGTSFAHISINVFLISKTFCSMVWLKEERGEYAFSVIKTDLGVNN